MKPLFRSHPLVSIIEKNPRKSSRKNRVRFRREERSMKPLFRRSKKTLADSKSLERIGLDFDERKDRWNSSFVLTPSFRQSKKKSYDIRRKENREALVSFSPPCFDDRKKTLAHSKSHRKNRVIISTRRKIDEALVSTIEKNPSRFEIPRKNQIIISTREKIDEALLSFSPPRFDDRKKTLGNSKSPRKNQRLDFDERKDR